MILFQCLLLALFAGALAAPAPGKLAGRAEAANYYNTFWTDNGLKTSYKNGKEGEFSVTWSGKSGDFVGGKGWNPGSARNIDWVGNFTTDGNAYLTVYGWTTNPLVEFYIVENFGTHNPSDAKEAEIKGNLTADGSDYEIMTKMRVNKPSIQGTTTFRQVWSIRKNKRSSGTVTCKTHFDAWKAAGLKLGGFNYMVMAVEGQDSNGQASVTVGVTPPPAATAAA